jgi:glutathione synthase/RimK-type ligase-like ATP-grasp enzyme
LKKLFIYSHSPSDSIKRLKESLRAEGIFCKSIKRTNSRYRNRDNHVVLNYGHSGYLGFPTINQHDKVAIATNKLKTFETLKYYGFPNIPLFSTSKEEAKEWIAQGKVVYCRTILNGSQGVGIVVASSIEDLVDAPLYVMKVPRNLEARIHVFNGEVIDFAGKLRRSESDYSNDVRNLSNGWVFCRENIVLTPESLDAAKEAVRLLGLDFGAVDIAVNRGIPKVLEVNTAPGLMGTTLERYKEAIKLLLNGE